MLALSIHAFGLFSKSFWTLNSLRIVNLWQQQNPFNRTKFTLKTFIEYQKKTRLVQALFFVTYSYL